MMTQTAALPWAFEPTDFHAMAAEGVPLADLLQSLRKGPFFVSEDAARRLQEDSDALDLVEVIDPIRKLQAFDDETKRAIWGKMQLLDAMLRSHFQSSDDPISISTVTCSGDSEDRAVVYWVRKSEKGTVQFQLGRVSIDLKTGTISVAEHLEPTLSDVQFYAHYNVGNAASDLITLVNSGAWALPPPWGAGVTVGLTFVQMIIGKIEEAGRPKVSPFQTLQDNLEEYIRQDKLSDIASDFHGFTHELNAKLSGLDLAPEKIGEQGEDYFSGFKDWLTGTYGYELILNRVEKMHDRLATRDVEDCKNEIELFVTGIALWVFGRKTHLTMVAIEASRARKLEDEETFFNKTRSWMSEYREVRNLLIGTAEKPDTGYIPMLKAQLKRLKDLKNKRLSQISAVSALEYGEVVDDKLTKHHGGYTFIDHKKGDSDRTHYVENGYKKKGCFDGENVPSKPTVAANRKAYIDKLVGDAESAIADAEELANGWKSALDDFANLLPPETTDGAPVATPLADGPPTPADDNWLPQMHVQYAMSYQNDKGPSELGPWSEALIVGETAFAAVKLPPVPDEVGTGTQVLHRRMYPAGGGGDAKAYTIDVLELTEAAYEDRNP